MEHTNQKAEVVEAEFEEVVESAEVVQEESVEPRVEEAVEFSPLVIRIVFYQGSPLEFTVHNYSKDNFMTFIANDIAPQLNKLGIFIGNAFIQNSKIKYFEQVL